MKVKCIDSGDSDNILHIDSIYEVERESSEHYILIGAYHSDGTPIHWLKDRFEVVKEDTQPATPTHTPKYPTLCPCDILATQCDYHRRL